MAFTIRTPPTKESLQCLCTKFPELDFKAVDLTVRLMICAGELEELMTAHFQEHELSQSRFSAMMMLYKSPHRRAKPIEMADYLGVTRGNMTGVLDNLERDGMIAREDDPDDRRINYVRLTEKGLRHLNKMLPDHFTRIKKFAQPLTKAERETFIECLNKLRDSMAELRKEFEESKEPKDSHAHKKD